MPRKEKKKAGDEQKPPKEGKEKIKPKIRHIVRVAGTDLSGLRTVERALWKIKGVSHMYAHAVRITSGINHKKKLGELKESEIEKIGKIIKNPNEFGIPLFLFNRKKDPETGKIMHLTSSDLEIQKKMDIRIMRSIKSYKGMRHSYGLKVRGQRTKSTGRKGSAVGVKRKKILAKQKESKGEGKKKGK